MTLPPHNDQPLGQIGPLQILEGDWGRKRQVSLGYPHRTALMVLPLDELLAARTVAEDDASEDDDPVLLDLMSRANDDLLMNPMNGYQFTQACMAGGYDPDRDGYHLVPWVVGQVQAAAHAAHPDQVLHPAPKKRARKSPAKG